MYWGLRIGDVYWVRKNKQTISVQGQRMFTQSSGANLIVVVMPPASIAPQNRTKDPEHWTESSGSKISGISSQDNATPACEMVVFFNRMLPVLLTLWSKPSAQKRATRCGETSEKIHPGIQTWFLATSLPTNNLRPQKRTLTVYL